MFSRYYRKVFRLQNKPKPKRDAVYNQYKLPAKSLIHERLAHWSVLCGVEVKRVAIRNQKTRWGSCSAHGNLNFNYKLLFLPACLRDYVIVHELCHLKELNHGAAFWSLVEKQIPNYRDLEKDLRKLEIQTRMMPFSVRKYSEEHQCEKCQSNLISLASVTN